MLIIGIFLFVLLIKIIIFGMYVDPDDPQY
jgi:hypothetical protein